MHKIVYLVLGALLAAGAAATGCGDANSGGAGTQANGGNGNGGSPANGGGGNGTVPGIPLGLTAVAGDATVALSWMVGPTSDEIQNYQVYRDGAMISNSSDAAYLDTGLVDGTTYAYRVSASNSFGIGTWSDPVAATPLGADAGAVYMFGNLAMGHWSDDVSDTTWNGSWNPPTGYGGPDCRFVSKAGDGPNGGYFGYLDADDRAINLTQDGGAHVRNHMISVMPSNPTWLVDGGSGSYGYSVRVPSGSQYTIPHEEPFEALELHGGSGALGLAPFLHAFWRGNDGHLHTNFTTTGGPTGSNNYAQQYTFGPVWSGKTFNPGVEFHQDFKDGSTSTDLPLAYDTWYHFRFDWHFSSQGTGTFAAFWWDSTARRWVNLVPTKAGLYNAYPASTGGLGPFLSNYYSSEYNGPATYVSQSDAPPPGRNRNRIDYAAGAFADTAAGRNAWQATRLGPLILP